MHVGMDHHDAGREIPRVGIDAGVVVEVAVRRLEMDEKISARLAEEKARLEVLRYQLNLFFIFKSIN